MAQEKPLEERYKRYELEKHVLELPGMYIGSPEPTPTETFLYSDAEEKMVKRQLVFVPALLKIFDEVLVNACDHSVRLKSAVAEGRADVKLVKSIAITIDREEGRITVQNDGDGIDVEMHPVEKVYIPTLILGTMLSSTNFDKNEERLVGGVHGIGAKAANIFSKEFIVETVDHRRKKIFTQRFTDNMTVADKPSVRACAKQPYTKISFIPDYARFGMEKLTDDMYELFRKRAYDACAVTDATVSVSFNDVKLTVKDFEKYADLYIGAKDDHPRVYEASSDGRWEVVATYSDHGQFDQVSFVNGICTIRGGKHVDYITAQITKKLVELAAAKKKKVVKAQHIKDNLIVFIRSMIVNPTFDSQTKETLTTMPSKFGSKFDLSDKFFDKVYKCGIMDRAISLTEFHDDKRLAKTDGRKQTRIFVNKLDDANWAGTKRSAETCLILTEGDSAKALAIAGLSVVGRDRYGVFPLKGKPLNTLDASKDKIANNDEISNLKKIIGLEQGKNYKDLTTLRYGSIMVLSDQDTDGSHIKGLVMNIFASLWPSLYKTEGFLTSMLTPIIKATNGRTKEQIKFYNTTDFDNWKKTAAGQSSGWTSKWFKGLGTSSSAESKEYFSEMKRVTYVYTPESDKSMDLAFNKKKADDRKAWLMAHDRQMVLDYNNPKVTYEEFVHKELVKFSIEDLERSIPNLCDGLKESIRKILYGCFKKRLTKDEIRVAQLAGYISEVSCYHHGEASLVGAIVGMAQNYVGANNINLLQPIGQFGTRINGGSDAASARYIHTLISPIATKIFREEDNAILKYMNDDGVPIQPEWYIGVIPFVLINGAMGIGSGFSTSIPSYNPDEVAQQCLTLITALDESDGDASVINTAPILTLTPWYNNFKGPIVATEKDGQYVSKGMYRWLDDNTLEVTEIPIGSYFDDYKEYLTSLVVNGSPYLKDFENHYTEKHAKFVLKLYPGARDKIEDSVESEFKLASTKTLGINNMHLYDDDGNITRYLTTDDIIRSWASVRLVKYHERKAWQIKRLEETLKVIAAKCRFIAEVIDGTLKVMNQKSKAVDDQLTALNYPKMAEMTSTGTSGSSDSSACDASGSTSTSKDYGYLTKMPIYALTQEKKEALERELASLESELKALRKKPVQTIWREEVGEFLDEWHKHRDILEKEYCDDVPTPSAKKRAVRRK